MRSFKFLIGGAIVLVCMVAQAQWQWLDKSGRKVFSDQAPPVDIPLRNILKQPRQASAPVPLPATSEAGPGGVTVTKAKAVPDLRVDEEDKYLTERKKKAEAEAQTKVKAEADQIAKVKAGNCETAKASQTLMDSGVRVSITNAKGEREILDDAARAVEQKKIRVVIEANCK